MERWFVQSLYEDQLAGLPFNGFKNWRCRRSIDYNKNRLDHLFEPKQGDQIGIDLGRKNWSLALSPFNCLQQIIS
jgi:hypothetical protein